MTGVLEGDSGGHEEAFRPDQRTSNEKTLSDVGHVGIRHLQPQLNHDKPSHLAVQLPSQLPYPSPSPSPSPTPRSLSPAIVVSEPLEVNTAPSSSTSNGNHYFNSLEAIFIAKPPLLDDQGDSISSPQPISKDLVTHELHDIPEEKPVKARKQSLSGNGVLRLSAAEMEKLTSAPESLPVISPRGLSTSNYSPLAPSPAFDRKRSSSDVRLSEMKDPNPRSPKTGGSEPLRVPSDPRPDLRSPSENVSNTLNRRPGFSSRAISTPISSNYRSPSYTKGPSGQTSPRRKVQQSASRPEPLDFNYSGKQSGPKSSGANPPSPLPQSIPLPPMSIPTYLQLELSSSRPSPLYIYRTAATEYPYESSKIKFERLLNFLLLPPQLEQVLYFGSLACLDAWLYTFTILPLRFIKASAILIQWWGQVLAKEGRFISGFIYYGTGRMYHRQRGRGIDSPSRSRSASQVSRPSFSTHPSYMLQPGTQSTRALGLGQQGGAMEHLKAEVERKMRPGWGRRHRRTKSHPSSLSSYHKADLLQGAVIICSCMILMNLDASRIYHNIRGQSGIKLYVFFNVLEVCDKLLAAVGQDILECLFSNETLERNVDGRSKILRPLGMFVLALIYNVLHASALFYQVVTLNVAVNSYSNALWTLLMSNQFVEIKGTVFKKIEKDNLFQLTCADIVERFQLWLMLMIIALRNIVEMGGLTILGAASEGVSSAGKAPSSGFILPYSFTILPGWSGEVLSPFVLVLGSEMAVDWIKHAYVTKFNNVKPGVYKRYLDVLAKDYYTNAFVNQNLVKRLGLPVIPLSCLFIRSSVQTYHMFLATNMPPPLPSTATSLSVESTTPATTAALEHFDNLIRRALGRSTFGVPNSLAANPWYLPSFDDITAFLTMLLFFLGAFLVLLALKLVLGMLLLRFARNRYRTMKSREHQNYSTEGKRLGGWGMTEVDDDKKRWIYDDEPEKLVVIKEKEKIAKEKAGKSLDLEKISRYELVKRIW